METVIYASPDNKNLGQMVNKIGKYLKKTIDGAYKILFHPMECEVFMRMYYQVPEDPDTFQEMHFIISITSYANKLRVNLTEETMMEKTIGQLILQPDEVTDLQVVRAKVLNKLEQAIAKEYVEYDFVY